MSENSELSDSMLAAMNWDFTDLKNKIIDLDLPCKETVQDLIRLAFRVIIIINV